MGALGGRARIDAGGGTADLGERSLTDRRRRRRVVRGTVVALGALTLAALGATLGGSTSASAATVTCTHSAGDTIKDWVGPAGGAFNNAANWSPAGVPGATNVVCSNVGSSITVTTTPTIAGANLKGSVTFNSGATITVVASASAVPSTIGQSSLMNNVTLNSGATLGGTMAIDLTGTNTLSGNVYGLGVKTILSGATANLVNGVSLGNATVPGVLKNAGTMNWTGTGYINMGGGGAILQNLSGGTFNLRPDDGYQIQDISSTVTKPKVINDSGATMDRNTVAGTTYISTLFDNNGQVTSSLGTLSFYNGNSPSQSDSGTYTANGSNVIAFNGGGTRTFTTSVLLNGTNGITLEGGTLNFPTASPISVQVLRQTGGTLTGSATVTNTFAWSGGVQSGTGTTLIQTGATATVANGLTLDTGHQLHNKVTLAFPTFTYLYVCNGAKFDNLAGGTVNLLSNAGYGFFNCGSPDGVVVNETGATINRNTETDTATIQPRLDNFGTVNVNTGTLDVAGNSDSTSDTGTWNVASPAKLNVSAGIRTEGASTLTGTGTYSISGGTMNFGSPTKSVAKLEQSGGSLDGNVTITSSLSWTGGIMTGTGTTTVETGVTATIPAGAQLDTNRALNNKGTLTWGPSGHFTLCDNAVFTNKTGGTFNILATGGYQIYSCGTGGKIVNEAGATVNRNTATDDVSISVSFDNFGTVNVNTGTLTLAGNSTGVQDTGTWNITLALGNLVFGSGTRTENAATFTGLGLLKLGGADVDFGTSTITVSRVELNGGSQAGNLTASTSFGWNGGKMTGAGTTTIPVGVTLTIPNGGQIDNGHKLLNLGTTSWGPSGHLPLCEGGVFENSGQFNIIDTGGYSMYNCGTTAGTIVNNVGATITKSAGAVATTIGVPLDNFGTVNVTVLNGGLNINDGTSSGSTGDTGTWTTSAANRTITFGAGIRKFNGGTISGAGLQDLNGSTFIGTPNISRMTWSNGGSIEYPGVATVVAGGTLSIPNGVTLNGKVLNLGTTTWASGNITLCGTSVLENGATGTFNIAENTGYSIYDCGPGTSRMVNDAGGLINRTTGTVAAFITAPFDNFGNVQVTTGTLTINGSNSTGVSDTGAYNVAASRTLVFGGGNRSFTNAATITGPGATQWGGAILSGSPTYNNTTIAWTGGNIAHPGTTTIGATATLNWGGTSLETGHILNQGTTNWLVNTNITMGSGATFQNAGLFDIKTGNGYSFYDSATGVPPLFTNQTSGTFRLNTAAIQAFVSVNFHNEGNIAVLAGISLDFNGALGVFDNFSGSTLTGGTYTLSKPFRFTGANVVTNNATIVLNAGGFIQDTSSVDKLTSILATNTATATLTLNRAMTAAAFSNAGAVNVNVGTFQAPSFTQSGGNTLVASGATLRSTGGTVAINGGTLRGAGTVTGTGNANVTGNGTVSPGVTTGGAGKLSVTGSYAPGASGTLAVDINGATTAGTDYDWLAMSTSATLNGTLAITTGAFTPTLGQTFTILTAGTTRTGTFATVTGDDIPGGLYYDVSYTATSVVLTVKAVPTIAIGDVTAVEGTSGTTTFTFVATLSADSGRTVTVPFSTTAGTAVAGTDYVTASGTITFVAHDTSENVSVTVNADALDEDDETFTVDLGTAFHATVADGQGLGTIQDDPADLPPTVSIDDQGVTEGDAGTSDTVFNVTLSGPSGKTITVPFSTTTGTATAADFNATSGTLTFLPGDTAKTVTVQVIGDLLNEATENYTVDLGAPTNASINDGSGTGTITDNDPIPTVSVADASITEPNAGTLPELFHVSLSAVSGQDVTVPFSTTAGSALAGSDFTAVPSGSITILAGATGGDISIDVVGDTVPEPTETYTVSLGSPTNATVADGSATGTILDDDVNFGPASRTFPGFVVDDPRTTEGGTLTFTVKRVGNISQAATVKYATANGTATSATSDYTPVALGTLSFPAGSATPQTVNVTTLTDAVGETNETVLLNLSAPTNGILVDAVGTGTINDSAATPPTFIIGDANANEGGVASFTVTRLGDTSETATVKYATGNNTAVAPTDYTAVALQTLTFNPADVTKTVNVTTINNAVDVAANKTFFVNLSAATNAGIADSQATGTIVDDEGTVVPGPTTFVAVNDVRQTEGGTAIVTITRRGDLSGSTTVTVNTGPGTATGGAGTTGDFTSIPGQNITFAALETTKTVSINTTNDNATVAVAEQNETFTLNASSATGGAVREDSVGTITINDNDESLGVSAFSIDDVRVVEGQTATFTVTRNGDVSQAAIVRYQTAFNTATSGTDFTPVTLSNLNFAAGESSKTMTVATLPDAISELNETFYVNLSLPTNGGIADAQGIGTITDKGNNPPTFAIGDVNVNEGSVATFTITRTGDTSETASVYYYTSASTATSPADYTNVGLTLATFNPGDTTKTFNVTTINNAIDVGTNKVFLVNLSGWKNAGVADAQARGTIIDDEGTPVAAPATFLSVSDVRLVEGAGANVVITRRGDTSGTTTVKINTGPVTATGFLNEDFTAISVPQTVTFLPGELTKTVTINTTNDSIAEQHEVFTANLSANSAGSFIEDAVGQVTIDDND